MPRISEPEADESIRKTSSEKKWSKIAMYLAHGRWGSGAKVNAVVGESETELDEEEGEHDEADDLMRRVNLLGL